MRDHTNLCWPEAPFGADQRPFGKPARILVAVTVEWACDDRGERLPVCAAAVYLRTRHAGTLQVDPDTLNVGFRVAVLDGPGEAPALVDLFDRALVRCRRHAVALAGHGLADDLKAVAGLIDRRLPGVVGVGLAWADRASKGRGMARMVDTRHDLALENTGSIDVPLGAGTEGTLPTSARGAELVAEVGLTRCLAIALTAAWHLDAYRWDGAFGVRSAVATAAWDRFASA
ncbi:MAG: hypothetical protein ACRDYA_19060 [Egibacteraceae bacterium]